ncbi:hypothetical protein KQX54_011027 [Cotesia glomerata]|uniref:Secreted protein n=1 Tax=Cotesia glomerata TaxID=32391 RepID=A0AAV7J751_COTGL|nr:hypothetical protein KQX54_011027 [Cotesia glomerata]
MALCSGFCRLGFLPNGWWLITRFRAGQRCPLRDVDSGFQPPHSNTDAAGAHPHVGNNNGILWGLRGNRYPTPLRDNSDARLRRWSLNKRT